MWDTGSDYLYGQATDDGNYDDVETAGADGTVARTVGGTDQHIAFLMVVGSLVLLWVFGASIFRGSNQS
jgi:hypothetical protein